MLKISKLTDYGTVILAELAATGDRVASASELAAKTGIGAPTVSKILKALSRAELVCSTRGASGGYRLARAPGDISAADIIDALEGPVSITDCSSDHRNCDFESTCNVGSAWQRINIAIRRALDDVSLEDLLKNHRPAPKIHFAGMPVRIEKKAHGN